jgi:hypothetical protein
MKLIECFYESPHFRGKHTSYFEVYEELLNNYINKEITLVEIGVNNGGKKALSMPIASINFYEFIVALKIKRKTDYLSDAIVNNKKTLNTIENKFANN